MWSRGPWRTCLLLVALVAGCGGAGVDADHNPGVLFPDRANQYREDQERRFGELAMLGGYSATVIEASLDDDGSSIQVNVEITNRDKEPQRVDGRQWTLVNPRVQTLEPSGSTYQTRELAGGETVTAVVSFAVEPGEAGDYYIQYKPEALDAARGIWQLTVP